MEETRNASNILVGIPEGKSQMGRLGVRKEDTIRTDLRERGWEGLQ
jgi:hypothetical protein